LLEHEPDAEQECGDDRDRDVRRLIQQESSPPRMLLIVRARSAVRARRGLLAGNESRICGQLGHWRPRSFASWRGGAEHRKEV
jgi:hypothetical protein